MWLRIALTSIFGQGVVSQGLNVCANKPVFTNEPTTGPTSAMVDENMLDRSWSTESDCASLQDCLKISDNGAY